MKMIAGQQTWQNIVPFLGLLYYLKCSKKAPAAGFCCTNPEGPKGFKRVILNVKMTCLSYSGGPLQELCLSRVGPFFSA